MQFAALKRKRIEFNNSKRLNSIYLIESETFNFESWLYFAVTRYNTAKIAVFTLENFVNY